MAKRPKATRRQSWRPPRIRKRSRAHWDREILEEVLSIWARSAKKVTPDTAGPYLYGITIGTLTAAKLMVRLQSGGSLRFDGDPRVLQTIEEMADEIAAEYFDVVADEVFGKGAYRARIGAEKRFLRLVSDSTIWRWSKDATSEDEPAPIDPGTLRDAHGMAEEITRSVMDYLALSRAEVHHDASLAMHEQIAQFTGMAGAAKLLLAVWANGKAAAAFELFAEKISEVEYQEMTSKAKSGG